MKEVLIGLIIYFIGRSIFTNIIKTRKDHYEDYLNRKRSEETDNKPF